MTTEERNYGKEILLDCLQDVTVDALVTNQHADTLAEELAAALHARNWMLCPLKYQDS